MVADARFAATSSRARRARCEGGLAGAFHFGDQPLGSASTVCPEAARSAPAVPGLAHARGRCPDDFRDATQRRGGARPRWLPASFHGDPADRLLVATARLPAQKSGTTLTLTPEALRRLREPVPDLNTNLAPPPGARPAGRLRAARLQRELVMGARTVSSATAPAPSRPSRGPGPMAGRGRLADLPRGVLRRARVAAIMAGARRVRAREPADPHARPRRRTHFPR
jgi:hypothetical protein